MIRAITFIPASGDSDGLTFVERASRNRSLHVLLQDRPVPGTLPFSAYRQNFLRTAYREIISRYGSFGRIEHPLAMARGVVSFLDDLSKKADFQVDDFAGIGFFAVFQDGQTFYLLTSRNDGARLRTENGYESLAMRKIPGVTELPLETKRTQKELFSKDVLDFLVLFKVESPVLSTPEGVLDLVLGSCGQETDTLLEAIDQPGVVEKGVLEKTIPLNLISRKMMFVRFDGIVPTRDVFDVSSRGISRKRQIRRPGPILTAVAALVLVSTASVWIAGSLTNGEQGVSPEIVQTAPGGVSPEEGAVLAPAGTDEPEKEIPGEEQIDLSAAWEKAYRKPVTSTPLLAGPFVVFGGRDGYLYALDKRSGQLVWKYKAEDGLGASPTMVGNRIIAADYKGNVFAVGHEDGVRLWNNRLPGRVVSSPCAGKEKIVVGCYDGNVYALKTETGRVAWKTGTGAKIRGSVTYFSGRYYVPSYNGKVYSLEEETGEVVWECVLGGNIGGAPAVNEEIVAIGDPRGAICGLERQSGVVKWKFETGDAVKSFFRLDGDKLFAGSNNGHLYCLESSTGELLWSFKTGGPVLGRPDLVKGYVIVPSYDGNVYCLDAATGLEADRFETGGQVFSSPVVDEGKVYFGNDSGKFYCLNIWGRETS